MWPFHGVSRSYLLSQPYTCDHFTHAPVMGASRPSPYPYTWVCLGALSLAWVSRTSHLIQACLVASSLSRVFLFLLAAT